MSGNKIGGRKAQMTLRDRLGDAGYREHMRAIGARGGKSLVQKGGLLDPRNRDQYPGKNKGRWLKDPQIKREQRLQDLEHGGRP